MSISYRLRRTIEAARILRAERDPWADEANDARLRAAAFADRVVGYICLAVALWILAGWIAPDVAAWVSAHQAIGVTR